MDSEVFTSDPQSPLLLFFCLESQAGASTDHSSYPFRKDLRPLLPSILVSLSFTTNNLGYLSLLSYKTCFLKPYPILPLPLTILNFRYLYNLVDTYLFKLSPCFLHITCNIRLHTCLGSRRLPQIYYFNFLICHYKHSSHILSSAPPVSPFCFSDCGTSQFVLTQQNFDIFILDQNLRVAIQQRPYSTRNSITHDLLNLSILRNHGCTFDFPERRRVF